MTALDWNGLVAREDLSEYQCQSDFATDYYGLGVRLGIYFAWLGSYIANTMLPAEFSGAADTSTIFLLTLLIAMTNDSRTDQLTQLDGLTLMHLCGGTVFGVLSIWGYRTRLYCDRGPRAVRLFGGFGTHTRLAVSLCVSIFGMWFWLHGVTPHGLRALGPDDGADPPNPPDCAVLYTFFFAKVRADGGIRFYYAVVCATCIVWFGVMFLASLVAGVASLEKIKSLVQFYNWGTVNRGKYATGFTQKELRYMYLFLRVGNLVWLLFSAVTVEVTLNFNHVHGVLGGQHDGGLQLPSQLLPFLIGLFSFLRIIYYLLRESFGVRDDTGKNKKCDDPSEEKVKSTVLVLPEATSPGKTEAGGKSTPPPPPRADSYHIIARSLVVRLLVGWLPWLGIVVHPETAAKSRVSMLVERGTGLSAVSPVVVTDAAYQGQFQHWTTESPGATTPITPKIPSQPHQ